MTDQTTPGLIVRGLFFFNPLNKKALANYQTIV